MLVGLGGFTFIYANGLSYFGSDPKTCVNCHIMQPQYDAWLKSSHHAVAVCVDCHLPHDTVPKYIAKADNGFHHSMAFTLQNFHEPIQIKPRNSRILRQNCIACHTDMVNMLLNAGTGDPDDVQCVHCHRSVGHGPRAGLGGSDLSVPDPRNVP